MRTLAKNKVKLYYALFVSKTPLEDEYGNQVGFEIIYTDPVDFMVNTSPSQGEVATRLFGDSTQYDKVLMFDNKHPAIDEQTRFWIDNLDITKPHDYEVKKIGKSLNNLAVAVKKVNVSA